MFNKIATFIAAIAIAVAFSVPAHAQAINDNTINFSGNVNRNDGVLAQVSVSGSLSQYSTIAPLVVHFTDRYNDFWCTASSVANAGTVVTDSTPYNQTGSVVINMAKMNCVDQHHGNTVVTANGTMSFATSLYQSPDTYQYALLSVVAKAISISFPCTPPCLYYSFNNSGIGFISNPL